MTSSPPKATCPLSLRWGSAVAGPPTRPESWKLWFLLGSGRVVEALSPAAGLGELGSRTRNSGGRLWPGRGKSWEETAVQLLFLSFLSLFPILRHNGPFSLTGRRPVWPPVSETSLGTVLPFVCFSSLPASPFLLFLLQVLRWICLYISRIAWAF